MYAAYAMPNKNLLLIYIKTINSGNIIYLKRGVYHKTKYSTHDSFSVATAISGKIFGTKWKSPIKLNGQESLISTFATSTLTANGKVEFLKERLGTRLCLHFI